MILLFVRGVSSSVQEGGSPHQVYRITWRVFNTETGETATETTGVAPVSMYFPSLTVDLCDIVGESWDPNPQEPFPGYGCLHPGWRVKTRALDFYVCPGHSRTRPEVQRCGGPPEGYCKAWGCETTGEAHWVPSYPARDLITVKRKPLSGYTGPGPWVCGKTGQEKDCGPCYDIKKQNITGATPGGKCNPLLIQFTSKGKTADWSTLKTWGLRLHRAGYDPFALFSISRTIAPVSDLRPIGPNLVLSDQKAPTQIGPETSKAAAAPPSPYITHASKGEETGDPEMTVAPTLTKPPGSGDRLMSLVEGAYKALNATNPAATEGCGLCLATSPPYYEGLATLGNFSNTTRAPDQCNNPGLHRLTLPQVGGQGLCIGKVPADHAGLCNQTVTVDPGEYYLVPPNNTWWACNTGLTPCVSAAVMDLTQDFCVLAQVMPRILYHSEEALLDTLEHRRRKKREPVMTLALLLGLGGTAVGIGTGTAALIQGGQQLAQLQLAIDTDLRAIENSISLLEKSLTSLSEVVLQNRRGLDLLFLKDKGLCAALGEECCFYADHTGVVKDSMAKLRDRLDQRQKDRDAQQNWFEGWFNRSPWITTLVSTLIGPLFILLLLLTFGPCILNRLLQFIKNRLSVVQALVLTQQYQMLKQQEP
ncbi:MLV-related proviral Env polyprotein-like [Muntiacus reevesi]|uniref:MLV-related proviral Env polyprotein-like n=1 Tax=Muntiacus reevesi TaxID=9886 RepID=UPI00330748D1